jgi:hypothetical protein
MMVGEMLAAYFDESGTHDSAVITSVAGFISTPERWQHFDEEWKRVLDHWGLDYFHMKECAHYRGDFAQFKADELGRKQLLWCLGFLICRHCLYGCAVSVVREDHEMLNADPRIGSAYNLAAQACIALADKWMGSQQHVGPMSVVLEDGCKYSKDFLDQLETLERPLGTLSRFGNIVLGSKRQVPALQAADLLAYEQSKYFTGCLKAETAVPMRKTLELLRIATPHDWKLLHLENIAELLTDLVLSDVMSLHRETLLKLAPDAVIDEGWQPLTRGGKLSM